MNKTQSLLNRVSLLVVCLGFVACSSAPKEPVDLGPTAASTAIPGMIARSIAADDLDELEADFQKTLNSTDPAAVISQQVKKVAQIYFHADSLVQDYDQQLAKMVKNPGHYSRNALMLSDPYAKLVSSWMLAEKTRTKISYSYARMLEMRTAQFPTSSEMQEKLQRVVKIEKSFYDNLVVGGQGPDQIAMQAVYEDLLDTTSAFVRTRNEHAIDPTLSSELQDLVDGMATRNLADADSTQKFLETHKKALQARAQEARQNKSIANDLEVLAVPVREGLQKNLNDRTPQQAAPIEPGSGPDGNITGTTYREGRWSLTFDDGPARAYTPHILENLENRGFKATFFALAKNVEQMPDLSKSEIAAGMNVGNHSYDHADLPKLNEAGWQKEIVGATEIETKIYGFKPKLYRCPYGACGPRGSRIRELIASEGMVHVFWNVDSLDWQDKNPESVYKRVLSQMSLQKRGIILFHDIHPQSVVASKMVMDHFASGIHEGTLRLLTVQQAINELNSPGGMK